MQKLIKQESTLKSLVIDLAIVIIVIVAIMIVIRPTTVRQHSMELTLQDGDYLFINKLAYVAKDHPDYKDIVVFKADRGDGEKLYIKRVIGVEGDTITIDNGDVYRNGEKLDEPYIRDGATDGAIGNLKIQKDKVFVMGDNRYDSIDSRDSSIGMVSESAIVGKAFFRLYPFDNMTVL